MAEEGWYVDPYGLHDDRWISDGTPTVLVRMVGWSRRTPLLAPLTQARSSGSRRLLRGTARTCCAPTAPNTASRSIPRQGKLRPGRPSTRQAGPDRSGQPRREGGPRQSGGTGYWLRAAYPGLHRTAKGTISWQLPEPTNQH
jgi:hypothetical protein